jgi:hypothetical protein
VPKKGADVHCRQSKENGASLSLPVKELDCASQTKLPSKKAQAIQIPTAAKHPRIYSFGSRNLGPVKQEVREQNRKPQQHSNHNLQAQGRTLPLRGQYIEAGKSTNLQSSKV